MPNVEYKAGDSVYSLADGGTVESMLNYYGAKNIFKLEAVPSEFAGSLVLNEHGSSITDTSGLNRWVDIYQFLPANLPMDVAISIEADGELYLDWKIGDDTAAANNFQSGTTVYPLNDPDNIYYRQLVIPRTGSTIVGTHHIGIHFAGSPKTYKIMFRDMRMLDHTWAPYSMPNKELTDGLNNISDTVDDLSSTVMKKGVDYVTAGRLAESTIGEYSTAEGYGCVASGTRTHAEGYKTSSVGYNSHSEGAETICLGRNCHSEGSGTTAGSDGLTAAHSEGRITIASGTESHAEGLGTSAVKGRSHAEGNSTLSSGLQSHAEGNASTASGDNSHAEGNGSVAYGESSHAEGQGTSASGKNSHSEGSQTTAQGDGSHAEGIRTLASGLCAHAEGGGDMSYISTTKATGDYSHAEGFENEATGKYSHAEGYNVGATNDAAHAEGYYTSATGKYSHAEGNDVWATGECSHAEGGVWGVADHVASGRCSHAEGCNTTASGDNSHSEGSTCLSSGTSSHAEGGATIASGGDAHSEGWQTTAEGNYSHAGGYGTIACNARSTAIGYFNKMTAGDGLLFTIGNGSSKTSGSNAFSVSSSGVVKAASTITASTTADYAEFFEWADGNPDNEDRVGCFITFSSGNKIRIADPGDEYILGVSSGEPFVLGNGDCDVWTGMLLRDEFRRVITEPAPKMIVDEETNDLVEAKDENGNIIHEGTRPVLNPEYDDTKKYINRKDRPEWCPVGMLGVLAVRDDGTCEVDSYCTIGPNGIAVKAWNNSITKKYRVIKRNSDNVVEIVFR